jgi:hypothetical protein
MPKEILMANKNKQEDGGIQGEQENEAGGRGGQTGGKKSRDTTKQSDITNVGSEGLQQGGSRGSSNQGKD